MYPELYSCCKTQPTWIFIYEDNKVYSICDVHFKSDAHRYEVKNVINFETRKCYLPDEIFGGMLVETL